MNIIEKHVILFLTSLIILISTLLVFSLPVENKESLYRVSFGSPLPFVFQDFSSMKEAPFFPSYYKFSPREYPLSGFSIFHFIADFLIIFGIIEGIVFLLEKGKGFFVDRKIWPYSRVD